MRNGGRDLEKAAARIGLEHLSGHQVGEPGHGGPVGDWGGRDPEVGGQVDHFVDRVSQEPGSELGLDLGHVPLADLLVVPLDRAR